jgi:hypothetical protein
MNDANWDGKVILPFNGRRNGGQDSQRIPEGRRTGGR